MVYSHKKQVQEGFTLIELVVVLLILGLLAGIGVPLVLNRLELGRENTTKTNLTTLKNQIAMYQMEQGKYPTKLDDLTKPPKGKPYMENIPEDGWGNELAYKVTSGKKHPYELYSYGSGGPDDPDSERIDVWMLGKKKE